MRGQGEILGAVHSLFGLLLLFAPLPPPPESCSVGLFIKPSQLPRVFSLSFCIKTLYWDIKEI